MSLPNWARAFEISEKDLATLKNELTGHDHPLRWMLVNGRIANDAYIKWARDEFGLPSVKENFFDAPADPVLWEAVKDEFKWSPSFFPLAHWEGVTLIGCLQPPDFHFPMRAPHAFVLASAKALEARFLELEPQKKTGHQIPEELIPSSHAPSVPEQDEDAAVSFESAASASHVRQRPADEILAEDLPAAPEVDMHDPDGLLIEVDSNPSIEMFAVPEGMQVENLGKAVPTTPDGFEDNGIEMDDLDFSVPVIEPQASPKVAEPVRETAAPPRVPVMPPGPPSHVASAAVAAQPKVEKSATPPSPPTVLRSNVAASEPAVPLATCVSIDSLMSAAVAHINVQYEHALVLTYDNAILKPAKWSEFILSTKGDNPDAISLEHASIFRVAARTSLPYHGYVVTNSLNNSFFNAFNRGLVPKHVTVMPVMIGGQLTAMLVGLGTESIDYKGSLSAMEKLASDFSTQLERLRDKQQAAA